MEVIIDLDNEIKAYFEELGVKAQEIKKASPLEWLGCLLSLSDIFFSGDALQIKKPLAQDVNMMLKEYDTYKLYILSLEYIKLSCKYNKIISYRDFADLVKMDPDGLYNYKHIKIFKNYNINNLLEYYMSNIDNYNNLVNLYNNNKDPILYNSIMDTYNSIYSSEVLNYLRVRLVNNLLSKAPQTLYKKAEGTNQGFSYALMINTNKEFQQEAGQRQNNTISISSLQNKLQIAQNKGHNIQE